MNIFEARMAANFAGVKLESPRDGWGVVAKVHVPGHEGRRYMVLLRREVFYQNSSNGDVRECPVLSGECLLDTGSLGAVPVCKARGIHYHILAAIIAYAKAKGQRVAFTRDESDARKLANLGGSAFRIAHHTTLHNVVWAIAYPNVSGETGGES